MTGPKGKLVTPVGLDASGIPYALAVDEDGYVQASLPGQAGSGNKRNPKGLLVSPVGVTPTGLLKNIQVAADGSTIITLVGGSANQVIKSDGTDAEWDDLSDVIEAVILTTNGDIIIRNGSGETVRLAIGTEGQLLTVSSAGLPAWETKAADTAAHQILDGDKHDDTVADTPTRGSVIVGNATPKWDELVLGAVNTILSSDGSDALYQTLANLLEAAILTADGDILIREGGVVKRLAKPAVGQILGESSQIPAWIAKPTGGYTEGARLLNGSDIDIDHNTMTTLTFDEELFDTDDIHSTVSNTSRLTCKTAGKYYIYGTVQWEPHATGHRNLYLWFNNTRYIDLSTIAAASSTYHALTVGTVYPMAVNEYVEMRVLQTAGVARLVYSVADFSPVFGMQRVG